MEQIKGQRVKIIDEINGHRFKIGEICIIKSIDGSDSFNCMSTENGMSWWLSANEFEFIDIKKLTALKISFDFDSTLSEPKFQKIARKFIESGNEVWITTTRGKLQSGNPEWNSEVFKTAEECGIKRQNIVFTGGTDKWKFVEDFDMHFDDDLFEIQLIDSNTNCTGIHVTN